MTFVSCEHCFDIFENPQKHFLIPNELISFSIRKWLQRNALDVKVALFSKRMLRFDNPYKRCKKNWQVEIYDDVPHRNLTEKVFDCTVFFKLKFYFDVCIATKCNNFNN